jgi:type I restriction enzyme S subunit
LSISIKSLSELEGFQRLDAEYYQPLYQRNFAQISKHSTITLGELSTKFCKGVFDIKADEYVDNGIPFVRIGNLRNWTISDEGMTFITPAHSQREAKTALRKYDVILSKTGYPAASLVQVETCNTSQDTIAIRTNRSVDFNFYLVAFLNSRYGMLQMQRIFQGNVQMHLSLPDARTIKIPIPSEDFQKKIRHHFEQSFVKRAEAEKVYSEAEQLLAAELGLDRLDLNESLFNVRRVSDVQQSKRADAEYYKRKYLNLMNYFDQKPSQILEQIATFAGGATPLGADYSEEGIPFLRIQNVGDNKLVLDDVAYINNDIHESELKRSQLAPRDVLITITGRIGTSAVVTDELEKANINQHIVRMRLKSKDINPFYLAAFLNSVGGRLQTEREAYGTTRDALPYYCLAKIRVMTADQELQNQIEQTVRKAAETVKDAERLLAEAKSEVERLIEGG